MQGTAAAEGSGTPTGEVARGRILKRYRQGKECARMNLNNQQDDT